jgi:cytochrome c-type biogenesis protein CcmH/NrfF
MRREIAALIESGGPGGRPMTGDEVIARYVAEQGEDILVAPRAQGFNLVAWVGPLVGLVAALLVMGWMVRRLASPLPAAAGAAPAGPTAADDELYRERLRRAIEDR